MKRHKIKAHGEKGILVKICQSGRNAEQEKAEEETDFEHY